MPTNQSLIFVSGAITTGMNLTANQGVQNTAIPLNSSGQRPRFVQLVTNNVVGAHVKLTNSTSVSVTANDWFITTTPINIETKGSQYLSYIADTATVTLNVGITELL